MSEEAKAHLAVVVAAIVFLAVCRWGIGGHFDLSLDILFCGL